MEAELVFISFISVFVSSSYGNTYGVSSKVTYKTSTYINASESIRPIFELTFIKSYIACMLLSIIALLSG